MEVEQRQLRFKSKEKYHARPPGTWQKIHAEQNKSVGLTSYLSTRK